MPSPHFVTTRARFPIPLRPTGLAGAGVIAASLGAIVLQSATLAGAALAATFGAMIGRLRGRGAVTPFGPCAGSTATFSPSKTIVAKVRWPKVILAAAVSGAAAAGACNGSSESGDEPAMASDGGDGPNGAPPNEPPQRADFGLDRRPPNPTCVAPARPPATGVAKLERVFENVALASPMAMAMAPGDKTRWFVAQRHGLIVSFSTSAPAAQPTVVASVPQLSGKPVHTDFEGGLLNLAFHPRFADNGRLFVTFTTDGTVGYGSEVGYLTSTDGGNSFISYTRVLAFDRPKLEHCGGGLAFGKDGTLYLSFGDGTVPRNGQSKTGFFAKVLRIDVDDVPPGQTYGIPATNPFKSGGGEPAVYAWGFRNPFRLAIDRATGDVWVTDVGDSSYEEVNRVALGGNYGWPCREGAHDHAHDAESCPSTNGLVDPIWEHAHAPTPNSRAVVGGAVYRGAAMPGLHGTFFYSDFIRLESWALGFDPTSGAPASTQVNPNGPQAGWSSVSEDADGELYLPATFQGSVHRLVPADPAAVSSFPERLSKTGCVDPADATKPAAGLLPFTVNAALWSDGATKDRYFAVPDGKTIEVRSDGDFDLPIGSVAMKTFTVDGKRLETRLLVRHDDGEWAGYSYEWDDAQKDAVLLPSSKTKTIGDRVWSFPSRSDCPRCHTAAAGRTLGLELGQLNGDHVYPSTNRIANQLQTLEHVGLFSSPLGRPVSAIIRYPAPSGNDPVDARARAYLHANCSGCHRPNGGGARAAMDLRFGTPLAQTKTCNIPSELDDLGVADARILAPATPTRSLLSLRPHATDQKRMPPLATARVDESGVGVLDEWIRSVTSCP